MEAATATTTPLLVLLDGILSQDEDRVADAMREISDMLDRCGVGLQQFLLQQQQQLHSPSSEEEFSPSPLRSAASLLAVLQVLLRYYPNLAQRCSSHDGSLPLHFAASLGNVPVADLLWSTYPPAASQPNTKGKIPLHYAAREGRTSTVDFLLRTAGAGTAAAATKKDKLPLHFAAGDGHDEVVRQLLAVHPDAAGSASAKGKLPLHFAARWGHLDIARDLLRVHPPAVWALDWEGSLPLHDAAREGQLDMARYLVGMFPAAVQTANLRGEIPLFPAVRSANVDLVVFFLQTWRAGGRYILQQVSAADHCVDWGDEIFELLLRGAVDDLHACPLLRGKPAPDVVLMDDATHWQRQRQPAQQHDQEQQKKQQEQEQQEQEEQRQQQRQEQQQQQQHVASAAEPCQTQSSQGSREKRLCAAADVGSESAGESAGELAGASSLSEMNIALPRSKSPILKESSQCTSRSKKRSASISSTSNDVAAAAAAAASGRNGKRSRRHGHGEYDGSSISSRSDRRLSNCRLRPPRLSRKFIPLHAALECGASFHVIKALMQKHSAEIDKKDDLGRCALHWAVMRNGAPPANSSSTPDADAAFGSASASASPATSSKHNRNNTDDNEKQKNHEWVVRTVLRASPGAAGVRDCQGLLPLHLAIRSSSSSRAETPTYASTAAVVQALLLAHPTAAVEPCRSNDAWHDASPLHMACHYHCDITTVFLLLKADPSLCYQRKDVTAR